jgi:hypothetical protein
MPFSTKIIILTIIFKSDENFIEIGTEMVYYYSGNEIIIFVIKIIGDFYGLSTQKAEG